MVSLNQDLFGQTQIDIAAVARFYFLVSRDAPACVDGFERIVGGNIAPYPSHRSAGARDSALAARTTDGTSTMTWLTAPIPATLPADSVHLTWVAGFGNNQGEEKFHLVANEQFTFEFLTSNEPHWRIHGRDGGHLTFVAIDTTRWGAFLGYMMLTLPIQALEKERGVTLQVTGAASANEVWYRTYVYRDVLQFIRTREIRPVYHDLQFWHLGDVILNLVAEPKWAGHKIALESNNKPLFESAFTLKDGLATAEIRISRELQAQTEPVIQVQLAGQHVAAVNIAQLNEQRIKAFLEEELVFTHYIFPPGKFPGVSWKRPAMVDNALGQFPLKTTFYDHNMKPVSNALEPGRYGAVVTGKTPAGFVVQRFVTLFCTDTDPERWFEVITPKQPPSGIQPDVWQSRRSDIQARFSGYLKNSLPHQPAAAIFLSGLTDLTTAPDGIDSPEIRDRQWWIEFKNRQRNLAQEFPDLRLPVRSSRPAPVLAENGLKKSPFEESVIKNIREVCRAWAEDAGEPLATLVAWKGRIVFHEAFGLKAGSEAMTVSTPTWMASITKLLTGVLLMQLVDQGLVQLDDPIENYLPELAGSSQRLTIRQLMTHTAGLGWHGEWASDWNPALENYLAQCLPFLKVGANFDYCRAGYAVVGKIMERITGRAVPYLFEDCLLKPLGMGHTFVDNTYGSMYATGLDLARLGQMLLNRGAYGDYRFFSEASYRNMLPQKLANIDKVWGIGTTPLGGNGLSAQAFGHEAASGAIFRIDPVHELIIVSARDRIGPNYEKYEYYAGKLIEACTAPLKAKPGTQKGRAD